MKKLLLTISMLTIFTMAMAQNDNREAIEKVLINSYVNAVFVDYNEQAIRDGFYKDFQFHFPVMTPT